MRIVITGGAGFLGTRLARALLERGKLTDARGRERAISRIVLVDVAPAHVADDRITSVVGDLADAALIESTITPDTDSVFHLAAVSRTGRGGVRRRHARQPDAAPAAERCRRLNEVPKVVFTSSLAVFGACSDPVRDR
jgi:nucleoside-diphosphate-sugar epimerase